MSKLCAFILAAGEGTRLRPLTEATPKPLMPVFHKPLMTFALDNLLAAGVEEMAFNTRYLSEKFYHAFSIQQTTALHGIGNYQDHPIKVFRELEHLDSGGALRNARSFLEQGTFLIHNGDIFSDISLKELIAHHRASGALATLLLRENEGILNVHFDEKNNRIVDFRNRLQKNHSVPAFAFASVAVAEPRLLDWISPNEGPASTIDALIDAMKAGEHIAGFVSRTGFWSDLGTPQDYLQIHLAIAQTDPKKKWTTTYWNKNSKTPWPTAIDPSAVIHPSTKLDGTVVIGAEAIIERDSHLRNCVILPGATIKAGSNLSHSIISPTTIITP